MGLYVVGFVYYNFKMFWLDCKSEGAKTNYVNKSVYRRTVC